MTWGAMVWGSDVWGGPIDDNAGSDIYAGTDGDKQILANGQLRHDATIASRCLRRLKTRRGQWVGDANFGSRFHEIEITKGADKLVDVYAKEALQPLVDDGLIDSITTEIIVFDPARGMIAARLFVTLTADGAIVPLGEITLG